MSTNKKVSLYNPRPESVDNNFTVHPHIYDRLWKDLTDSKMEFPEQHYLINGEHGSGKTTLLAQLHKSAIQRPFLISLQSLFFNEEEYSIRHLYRLWERIFELLNDQGLTAKTLITQVRNLSDQIDKNQEYEKNISNTLLDFLETKGIHLLLFIDNFDLILQKLSTAECHRFRKILQTSSRLRIVAAASEVPASFYQYEHPFYEFFKVVHLRALSFERTKELLLKLLPGDSENIFNRSAPAIETIRRMTNGNTRCAVLLTDVLKENANLTATELFSDMLDKLTPAYKFIMDDLPAQQQQIVEAIALNYEAISVKELGSKLRMESKIISAQLAQLVKNNLIVKIKTSTKNHFYHLKNRLFNCWYLLRLGRNKDRKKLTAILNFTETWLQNKEKYQNNVFPEIPLLNIDTSSQFAPAKKSIPTPGSQLIPGRAPLRSKPNADLQFRQRAYQALHSEQYQLAIQLLQKTKATDHFALAVAYHQGTSDYQRAITHYKKAGNADALNNLGLLHLQQHSPTAAKKAFLGAAKKGSVLAQYNLGLFHLQEEQNIAAAMDSFEKAITQGSTEALLPMAQLYYHQFKKSEQAIMTLSEAAATNNPSANYQLGLIYLNDEKDEDAALHYFSQYLMHPSTQTLPLPLGLTLLKYEAHDFLQTLFSTKPEIKTTALPLYYALQKLDINANPDETLRMGKELEITVNDLVRLIKSY